MTLKTLIILGVVEQVIMFTIVLPATGFWFSFFGLTAIWNIFAQKDETDSK